jgi:DNA-binding IclR family transcriptional regulator
MPAGDYLSAPEVTGRIRRPRESATADADDACGNVDREEHSSPQKTGAVGQTLRILRFLADEPVAMGVNAISRATGIVPSSCFRILKQLREAGFAQFDNQSKCYSLGSAAVMLARRALDPANIFSLIQPGLRQFAADNDTSVCFWRRIEGDRIVLAGFLESPNPLRIHMSVGQRLPLFIGAVGRAFAGELALTDEAVVQELSRLHWQSAPDPAEYLHQVAEYRRCGYAIDENNFATGVTSVATVLRDAMGEAGFGLSAIRLSGQGSADDAHRIGQKLIALKHGLGVNWFDRGR